MVRRTPTILEISWKLCWTRSPCGMLGSKGIQNATLTPLGPVLVAPYIPISCDLCKHPHTFRACCYVCWPTQGGRILVCGSREDSGAFTDSICPVPNTRGACLTTALRAYYCCFKACLIANGTMRLAEAQKA